jgi:acylphosphatase
MTDAAPGSDSPEAAETPVLIEAAEAAVFAVLEGRVQGVGFRYHASQECRRLGLAGWVQNTRRGKVELWAEGPKEQLAALLQWLRDGPPGARVDSLVYDYRPATGQYTNFFAKYRH